MQSIASGRELEVASPSGLELGAQGPKHVGIIMDGNGRWAQARGLSRSEGHRAGARVLESVFNAAVSEEIEVVTLYAFSSDNWQRSGPEVDGLMRLFNDTLVSQGKRCREDGVRLQVIGRRDRLPNYLRAAVKQAEWLTRRGRRLLVRVAVDYSGRSAILKAAGSSGRDGAAAPQFRRRLAEAIHSDVVADPDLIIRTGGEQRLSDFLLWESAYAELLFLPEMWPEFSGESLHGACEDFRRRQRRFGAVPASPVA